MATACTGLMPTLESHLCIVRSDLRPAQALLLHYLNTELLTVATGLRCCHSFCFDTAIVSAGTRRQHGPCKVISGN